MGLSSNDFVDACSAEDIYLHADILGAGLGGHSCLSRTHEPDGYYACVAAAGNLLREYPDTQLAQRMFDYPGVAAEILCDSVAGHTLFGMVNASIEPVPGTSWDSTFWCANADPIAVCPEAEVGFGLVLEQMRTPDEPVDPYYKHPVGYQIITGENDRPIAVRKGTGEPSTLSLVPITVNGIPYPSGSIFRANIVDEVDPEDPAAGGYYTFVSQRAQTRFEVERISHIAFRRLSAFAEELVRRAKFSIDNPFVRKSATFRASMEEITAIAQSALVSTLSYEPIV